MEAILRDLYYELLDYASHRAAKFWVAEIRRYYKLDEIKHAHAAIEKGLPPNVAAFYSASAERAKPYKPSEAALQRIYKEIKALYLHEALAYGRTSEDIPNFVESHQSVDWNPVGALAKIVENNGVALNALPMKSGAGFLVRTRNEGTFAPAEIQYSECGRMGMRVVANEKFIESYRAWEAKQNAFRCASQGHCSRSLSKRARATSLTAKPSSARGHKI